MKILEVDVDDAYNQIFTFDALSNNGKHRAFARPDDKVSGTGKFVYRYLDDLIFMQLELLQKNNKANTVSSPVLLASNNRTARLFVGEERLLIRGATLTDPVVNANGITVTPAKITYETEIRNVGNTLNITPKINADGTVTLGIFQDTSSVNQGAVDFPPLVANGVVVNISLDTVNTANIEGVVVAKDGLTVAIGGLIRNTVSKEESKVPVLGDIPVIGNVFKDKIESASRKELILLITPHIITAPSESDDVTRDTVEPLTEQKW
jgi:general secretion pathway protein D